MDAFPVLILILVLVLHLVPLLLLPEGGSEGEWPDQRTLTVGTTGVCWAQSHKRHQTMAQLSRQPIPLELLLKA